MNNSPQWPNDPNDPHAQDTVAGQYPQQPSYPQQAPPPSQYSQPGQFGPPPNLPQLTAKPPLRQRFRAMPRWKRFGTIGCSTIIGAIMICSLCAIVSNALPKAPQPPETTIASALTHQTVQRAPTTKPKPTQKPKPTPTATPTPAPSPTATPTMPTPTPTPMPVQQQAPVQQPPAQQAPVQPTPTPPPPATQLFVSFTGASAVDNSSGSVSVHTLAEAALRDAKRLNYPGSVVNSKH
jgi:hypothetical protein